MVELFLVENEEMQYVQLTIPTAGLVNRDLSLQHLGCLPPELLGCSLAQRKIGKQAANKTVNVLLYPPNCGAFLPCYLI